MATSKPYAPGAPLHYADASTAAMEKQLAAPLRIQPLDSLPLTLPQAGAMLAQFLSQHGAGPIDTGTRALLSRLHAGIQHEAALAEAAPKPRISSPATPRQPSEPASAPPAADGTAAERKKKRKKDDVAPSAEETEEERRARKRARKEAKRAAKLAASQVTA